MNKFKAKSLFLAAAGISFVLSVTLWFAGNYDQGLYVGIWVPSICSAGSLILAGGKKWVISCFLLQGWLLLLFLEPVLWFTAWYSRGTLQLDQPANPNLNPRASTGQPLNEPCNRWVVNQLASILSADRLPAAPLQLYDRESWQGVTLHLESWGRVSDIVCRYLTLPSLIVLFGCPLYFVVAPLICAWERLQKTLSFLDSSLSSRCSSRSSKQRPLFYVSN